MESRSECALQRINRVILRGRNFLLVTALLILGANTTAEADTITLAGSTAFNTTIMVPHQKEIEAVTGHKLIVLPSKTDLGVKLLFEKRADLAMISTEFELL